MDYECPTNVDQMNCECLRNDIQMLANVLLDIDAIHQEGHMEPQTLGAIISLVAWRMQQVVTECRPNAH